MLSYILCTSKAQTAPSSGWSDKPHSQTLSAKSATSWTAKSRGSPVYGTLSDHDQRDRDRASSSTSSSTRDGDALSSWNSWAATPHGVATARYLLHSGRRHSLPRTKLVRVVSRPPTTTPGSTSPLEPPRRTTIPRPAHRLTCADLVPRRARDHSLTTSSVLFTRPGEGSCDFCCDSFARRREQKTR